MLLKIDRNKKIKISDVVTKEVKKATGHNELNTKANNLELTILAATTLIHINQYSTEKTKLREKDWWCWWKVPGLRTRHSSFLNIKVVEGTKKLPDTSSLVTTTILNTTIVEFENKILDVSSLLKKTDYNAKILQLSRNILLLLIIMNLQVKYLVRNQSK